MTSSRSRPVTLSLAVLFFFALGARVLLLMGDSPDALWSSPPSAVHVIVRGLVALSGLAVFAFVPGGIFADRFRPAGFGTAGLLVFAFVLNIVILPALVVAMWTIGVDVSTRSMIPAVFLLCLAGAIIPRRRRLPVDSARDRGLAGLLITSALVLVAITAVFHKTVFTPLDRYLASDALEALAGRIPLEAGAVGVQPDFEGWTPAPGGTWRPEDVEPEVNFLWTSPSPRRFRARFVTNRPVEELELLAEGPSNEGSASSGRSLGLTETKLDERYGYGNRLIVSQEFDLKQGANRIRLAFGGEPGAWIYDVSGVGREGFQKRMEDLFLVAGEPEVGDAVEAGWFASWPVDSWEDVPLVNPPLIYLAYHAAFQLLGDHIASINVTEISLMLMVVLLSGLLIGGGREEGRSSQFPVVMFPIAVFLIAIISLPVIHTASGLFLSVYLAATWFMWKERWILAAVGFVVLALLRYEGVLLACMSLGAYAIVTGDWRNSMKAATVFALACGLVGAVMLVGHGFDLLELGFLRERFDMVEVVPGTTWSERVLDYASRAMVLSVGMPLFWPLISKRDRVALYCMLVAVLYFVFLCTLSGLRAYHFGPVVIPAAIAGARAILGIKSRMWRWSANAGIALAACASVYVVLAWAPRPL